MPQGAEIIHNHNAAVTFGSGAERLRQRSVDEWLQTASKFARSEPVALFGGTLLAGFALSRFLNSSRRTVRAGDNQGLGGIMPSTGRSLPDISPTWSRNSRRWCKRKLNSRAPRYPTASARPAQGSVLSSAAQWLLIPALVVLLNAAVAALTDRGHLAPYWAALIVGGIVLILGMALLALGSSRLRPANMIPTRTIHQF